MNVLLARAKMVGRVKMASASTRVPAKLVLLAITVQKVSRKFYAAKYISCYLHVQKDPLVKSCSFPELKQMRIFSALTLGSRPDEIFSP